MQSTEVELHVHPFGNSLDSILKVMERRKLDVVAIEALNRNIYDNKRESVDESIISIEDEKGFLTIDGKYILKAREYSTKQGFHILTVGCELPLSPDEDIRRVIDSGLKNDALVILDHPYADNKRTLTAGHIGPTEELFLEELAKEYSGEIAVEWNAYCHNSIRMHLKNLLNTIGKDTYYHDVNQKAEDLSYSLLRQGYNLPIVADTDLHARYGSLLNAMGTARVIAKTKRGAPEEMLSSFKDSIFKREHRNVMRYVSAYHVLRAYCFPVVMPTVFPYPRS